MSTAKKTGPKANEKKAEPKAAKKPAATAKPVEPKTASAAEQAKSEALSDLGETLEVRFGLIRNDFQVRKIREKSAQDELDESVKEGKLRNRFVVFRDENGFFQTIEGGGRLLAMQKAGHSPDAYISVIIKPKPKTAADLVVAGTVGNIHQRMVWPDMARVVGIATGIIDEAGNITKMTNLSAAKAAAMGLRTSAQLSKEFGMAQVTINTYQRIARAPYDDLVQIYEAGGSMAHGDVYAAYNDKDKAEALAHYVKNHAWPETVQPERRRAEKKPKNGAAKETQASITGKGKQKPSAPKGDAQTTWTRPAAAPPAAAPPAAAAPSGPILKGEQASLFRDPPVTGIIEAPAVRPDGSVLADPPNPDADRRGRRAGELEEIADHFGISLELAQLIDAAIDHWPQYGLELTHADDVGAMERAVEAWKASGLERQES